MLKKLLTAGLAASFAAATLTAQAAVPLTNLTLSFDELGNQGNVGSPITTNQGFTFDSGSYLVTALGNNLLTTTDALRITRTDGSAFRFDSVDYAARGGESREYFFLYTFADGSRFDGRNLNTSDAGNFRTSVGDVLTEPSGTSQLILSITVVGKQTETADYTYLALDNLRAGVTVSPVPEPGMGALLAAGLGLIGMIARRRRGLPAKA
jgi:hypothetical protein